MPTTLIVLIVIALICTRFYFIYREVMRRVDAYLPPSQGVVLEYSRGAEKMRLTIPPGTPKEEMQAVMEAFRAGLGDASPEPALVDCDSLNISGRNIN